MNAGWDERIRALRADAAGGRRDAAMALLEEIVAGGGWLPWDWLADQDFALLAGDPRFEEIREICRERQRREIERSAPSVALVRPAGEPPWVGLVALHGNVQNVADALPWWSGAAAHGYLVALPQSGTPVGPLRYAWAAATTGEVRGHVASLRGAGLLDASPPVLGGFGRGGYHALRLAVTGAIPACGAVAVAPAMNDIDELLEYLPSAAERGVRVAFHAGERDERTMRAVARVGADLERGGVAVRAHTNPLGRDYPPEFGRMLPEDLAWIARR